MAQPKVRGSSIRPACWQGPASASVFEASGICATSHLPEEATRPTQAPPPQRASAWLAARAGLAAHAPGSGRGLGWGLTTCVREFGSLMDFRVILMDVLQFCGILMDFRKRGNRNVMFPRHFGPRCKAPNYQGRGRFHKAGTHAYLKAGLCYRP